MQGNILKALLLFCLIACAVAAGHRFLRIDIVTPFERQEEASATEPVLTTQLIQEKLEPQQPVPVQEPVVQLAPKSPPTRDDVKVLIVKKLESKGAKVLDSRVFDDKAICDTAVKVVIGEYRKRGIQERDTAETAPFDGSTGSVWMLRNGDNIYYVGCITPEHIDWAVYVHFVPGAAAVAQP